MRFRRILLGTPAALTLTATAAFAQASPPSAPPANPATPAAPQASAAKPAAAGPATSFKGTWVGFADTQGNQLQVKFVFDSTATGWVGASPGQGADSLYLETVKVKGDSLVFSLNYQGTPVGIRGVRSGDSYTADLVLNGQVGGTVRLAKAGSAAAAALLTPPFLDDHRR